MQSSRVAFECATFLGTLSSRPPAACCQSLSLVLDPCCLWVDRILASISWWTFEPFPHSGVGAYPGVEFLAHVRGSR